VIEWKDSSPNSLVYCCALQSNFHTAGYAGDPDNVRERERERERERSASCIAHITVACLMSTVKVTLKWLWLPRGGVTMKFFIIQVTVYLR